ncbi:MAG: YebC/PmpR family DNA-binding transcriptional regulator [Ignavibacteriae bacterium]|nr:YebC/PmpR family DNA-binding transcriptional regulator [Ignavibacteria bacterium]MBI3364738.1 YebC/PmpR family DNA-binding transcriptional regulator [Ignavibacteriota bacterium]
MGRAFEFRRARKEKRWGKMAVAFTKLSKEITLAVKKGGPEPDTNLRLRVAIEASRAVNMPKDKIEAAIKRATSKEAQLEEVVYEGYGPHGIAIVVETATDNPTRTVGNIRSCFTHAGGSLGTSGSLDFLFERKGVFQFPASNRNLEELELELIDYGAEEFVVDDGEVFVYTGFGDFVTMQKAFEQKGIQPTSAEIQRIPTSVAELPENKAQEVNALIERLEEDEDVQTVYHTMK